MRSNYSSEGAYHLVITSCRKQFDLFSVFEAAFSPVLSFRLRLLLVAFCEETFTVVYPVYTLSDTTSYTLRVPASILLFFFSLGRNLSIAAKQ